MRTKPKKPLGPGKGKAKGHYKHRPPLRVVESKGAVVLGGTEHVMNVAELLEQQFGVKTTHEVSAPGYQVGTSVQKILAYNPRRLAFIMVNLGANEVCVAPDAGVLLTRGIYLAKTGGTLTIVWTEDFEMPTFEWYGIANTAAANFFVLEVLTQ